MPEDGTIQPSIMIGFNWKTTLLRALFQLRDSCKHLIFQLIDKLHNCKVITSIQKGVRDLRLWWKIKTQMMEWQMQLLILETLSEINPVITEENNQSNSWSDDQLTLRNLLKELMLNNLLADQSLQVILFNLPLDYQFLKEMAQH